MALWPPVCPLKRGQWSERRNLKKRKQVRSASSDPGVTVCSISVRLLHRILFTFTPIIENKEISEMLKVSGVNQNIYVLQIFTSVHEKVTLYLLLCRVDMG